MKNINAQLEELASSEAPIEPYTVLEEIKPLLEEYFVGEITFDGKRISYSMPNGQKIVISAREA